MNQTAILVREGLVSAVINGAISIAFFLGVFGLAQPAPVAALGRDCLPQAFMVSLMGSLVPALLLRRKAGGAARPLVIRAVMLAVAGAVVAGGGAVAACASSAASLPPGQALAAKALFGAVLGLIVTPIALTPLLRSPPAR